jgi:hypothetical protein
LEFYHGYGSLEKGICYVTYSAPFFEILAESPYAEKFFPGTVHFSADDFIIHCEDEVSRQVFLQTSVIAMLRGVSEHLKRLTGYTFEELEAERHRLLVQYRWKTEAPFEFDLF